MNRTGGNEMEQDKKKYDIEKGMLSNVEFARIYRNIQGRINTIYKHNEREIQKREEAERKGEIYRPKLRATAASDRAMENFESMKTSIDGSVPRMAYAKADNTQRRRMTRMLTAIDEWETIDTSGAKSYDDTMDKNLSDGHREYTSREKSAIITAIREEYEVMVSNIDGMDYDSDQMMALVRAALGDRDYMMEIDFEDYEDIDRHNIKRTYKKANISFNDLIDSKNKNMTVYDFLDKHRDSAKKLGDLRKNERSEKNQEEINRRQGEFMHTTQSAAI